MERKELTPIVLRKLTMAMREALYRDNREGTQDTTRGFVKVHLWNELCALGLSVDESGTIACSTCDYYNANGRSTGKCTCPVPGHMGYVEEEPFCAQWQKEGVGVKSTNVTEEGEEEDKEGEEDVTINEVVEDVVEDGDGDIPIHTVDISPPLSPTNSIVTWEEPTHWERYVTYYVTAAIAAASALVVLGITRFFG